MEMFSTSRPIINGKPAYISGMAVLPDLFLGFCANAPKLCKIATYLPIDNWNDFSLRVATFSIENLSEILNKYRNDPENTLRELFPDWKMPQQKQYQTKNAENFTKEPLMEIKSNLVDFGKFL